MEEPNISTDTGFKSSGAPGPEQNMKSSGKSKAKSKVLEEVSSPSKTKNMKAESIPESVPTPPDEAHQESINCTQNPYVQQHYKYMYLYHLLDNNLTAVNSELTYIGQNVYRVTKRMKDCSDSMDFFGTRMLSLQKEMLHALRKTNSSLQSAVHLLREIKENQSAQSSARATPHTEPEKASKESDEASLWSRKQGNRHRSRSGNRSSQQCKRYKEK